MSIHDTEFRWESVKALELNMEDYNLYLTTKANSLGTTLRQANIQIVTLTVPTKYKCRIYNRTGPFIVLNFPVLASNTYKTHITFLELYSRW